MSVLRSVDQLRSVETDLLSCRAMNHGSLNLTFA